MRLTTLARFAFFTGAVAAGMYAARDAWLSGRATVPARTNGLDALDSVEGRAPAEVAKAEAASSAPG